VTLVPGLVQAVVICAGGLTAFIDFEVVDETPPPFMQWIIFFLIFVSAALVVVNTGLVVIMNPNGLCCCASHEDVIAAVQRSDIACCKSCQCVCDICIQRGLGEAISDWDEAIDNPDFHGLGGESIEPLDTKIAGKRTSFASGSSGNRVTPTHTHHNSHPSGPVSHPSTAVSDHGATLDHSFPSAGEGKLHAEAPASSRRPAVRDLSRDSDGGEWMVSESPSIEP